MTVSTGPVSPPPGPGSAGLTGDPLGTGVAFPFAPDLVTGSLDWLSGAALVRQSIQLILQTEPTERVMLPTFGAGLAGWPAPARWASSYRASSGPPRPP